MADERDLKATVESCSEESDTENGVSLAPTQRKSPLAANSSAKRSSNDMEQLGVDRTVNIDLQSDSGYSSHTAATSMSMSSADSARSPPVAPTSAASNPPPSPATSRRRPTIVTEDRKHSSQSSPCPAKQPQRASSTATRRTAGNRRSTVTENIENCTDPNCNKCGPHALSNRSRRGQPSRDSALDVSYPYDVRSQRSDPAPSTYTSPPSPTYSRQPAPYVQGPAIVQPAQTRRRSSSIAGSRRPMSYSGDPGHNYWTPGMPAAYPNQSQDHGPPLSMARYNMQHQQPMQHPQMSPYVMPQNGPYYPSGQSSAPYEYPRPHMSARTSSTNTYQARGPMSGHAPVITQSDRGDPMPSARFSKSQVRPEQRYLPQPDESEYSESGSSSDEEEEEEEEEHRHALAPRKLMPPPALKSRSSKERRPSLRHAKTSQVVNEHRRAPQPQTLPERPRERHSRDQRSSRSSNSTGHSRATSVSRPTLVQGSVKAQSYESQRPTKVVVENSKSRNRQTYQTYGSEYEPEPPLRRNRNSKIYDDESEYEQKQRNRTSRVFRDEQPEIEPKRRNRESRIYYEDESHDAIIAPHRSRRPTDASSAKLPEYFAQKKERHTAMDAAEAYQQRARGNEVPLNDVVHKAALKKQTRTPSDGVSNRSDDKKSRISRAPTTTTNAGGGEIRLRVDASAPLSLSFNGDMEGRTLQFQPGEGGMADIVIGSSRENETSYRSERGSVMGGRRAIAAPNFRRDAEDLSVRSSRSSNSRREPPAERPHNILRRRTEYY